MKTRLDFLFTSLVVVAIVQSFYFYPHLPDMVATHFARQGRADGWMDRDVYMIIQASSGIILLLIYIFAGRLHLPESSRFISLPNRDYWLHESRRAATQQFIQNQGQWFVFFTFLFLLVVHQLVINANLGEQKILSEQQMWASLLIYGVYVVVWLVRFYRRFTLK